MTVDISGLDKSELLFRLFNRSRVDCIKFFDSPDKTKFTLDMAKELLDQGQTYFQCLYGCQLNIDIGGDVIKDTSQYNKVVGENAAENVVAEFRKEIKVKAWRILNPLTVIEFDFL